MASGDARQSLPAVISTEADTLDPEVAPLELGQRDERSGGGLAQIDVAINLIAGQHDLVPVDKAVANHRSPIRIDVVEQVGVKLRRVAEVIMRLRADVRRLSKNAAGGYGAGRGASRGNCGRAVNDHRLVHIAQADLEQTFQGDWAAIRAGD